MPKSSKKLTIWHRVLPGKHPPRLFAPCQVSQNIVQQTADSAMLPDITCVNVLPDLAQYLGRQAMQMTLGLAGTSEWSSVHPAKKVQQTAGTRSERRVQIHQYLHRGDSKDDEDNSKSNFPKRVNVVDGSQNRRGQVPSVLLPCFNSNSALLKC
ncbi:hypothetical protein GQ42DRAFT_78876 [Ramicandelaber brevisporus]|nr:hypothetical protein GQ42DRAFT_78876 [Ramicandelaber brevisporus]